MADKAQSLTENTTEIKFEESELKSLTDLKLKYQEKNAQFGDLKIRRILLNQQLENLNSYELQLEEEYKNTQSTERELLDKLNKKYGPGTLDPETGTFTPQS